MPDSQTFQDNIAQLDIRKMAAAFAFSEVLIKNNLSNSLIANIGSPGGTNDTHGIGSVGTLYLYSKYYYCLLNCLKALKDSIGNKFNKTVFQISGDFNRTPKLDERIRSF